jgi:hypothetical protein
MPPPCRSTRSNTYENVRVTRDRLALHRIEAAQLVETEDVIRVRVGEQHRVDPPDPVGERLLSQIGRGIDQDAGVVGNVEINRRPQTPVAGIARAAGAAVAADHRHAVRRPRAEKGDASRDRQG